MTSLDILVTDGEQRAALAVVRSLGAAGHRVYVVSRRGRSLAGASRFSRAEFAVPDPLLDTAAYVDALVNLVRSERLTIVIPITDASMLAVLGARERFDGARIPFSNVDTFRRISDKAALLDAAPRFGIAIPEQTEIASPTSRRDFDPGKLRYPIVLKPARSVGEYEGRRTKLSVEYAEDAIALERALDVFTPAAYPVLLQQRIIGSGVGLFFLVWDDVPLAVFAHRRLREKPPAGGVSVYRESIPADPVLVQSSVALLQHFQWRGVAMVEYKVDESSGTPYLMEINGRFWGSLQLAIDAGVDFPTLLVRAAAGEHVAPVTSYRVGVRSRWWWGDVDHLLARLRHSPRTLALPPGAPGRWRTFLRFMRLWSPRDRNEILRARDPIPFLHETLEWLQRR